MVKQIRTYALRVAAQDVKGRVLLEARAGQVPFIHGYTIDMAITDIAGAGSDDDTFSPSVMLQANPQAPTTPFAINTNPWLALVNHQGNIAAFGKHVEFIVHNVGGSENQRGFIDLSWSTGYVPVDLEVPGLWVVTQLGDVGATGGSLVATITLHFDWVPRSSLQIAALYTTYGIDSVDMEQREATAAGEIRFGQTVAGEQDKPTVIS